MELPQNRTGSGAAGPSGSRAEPWPSASVLTLPNAISLARLCAVPVTIWLVLRQDFAFAFGLFLAAGISDFIDGWLARRQGGTAAGAILDPLADKALMVAMFVTLAAIGHLPSWVAILAVFRDLLIVGGVVLIWMLGGKAAIRPLFVSKLNTAVQLVLIGTVLGLDALHMPAEMLRTGLIWLAAGTTFASGAAYVRRSVSVT